MAKFRSSYSEEETSGIDKKKIILITVAAFIALVAVYSLTQVLGCSVRQMNVTKLPCRTTQDVTPLGDNVIYYNGSELVCVTSSGSEKWRYTVGRGASFHTDSGNTVAWTGTKLVILDRNGHASYDNQLTSPIQFARAGEEYVAVVMGEDISPQLVIKDLSGMTRDNETNAYEDKLLLDCGFFSDGTYLWTTALDVYGTVQATTMNTYRVGQMNTGETDLGEQTVYRILYSEGALNVVSTRQLRRFDYRCVEDESATRLVYGWQLIHADTEHGPARMLYARTKQTSTMELTDLRYLSDTQDTRYTLPNVCTGACLYDGRIYAFSSSVLYRADVNAQRFSAINLDLDAQETVAGYIGLLEGGVALLSGTAGNVYAVKLP